MTAAAVESAPAASRWRESHDGVGPCHTLVVGGPLDVLLCVERAAPGRWSAAVMVGDAIVAERPARYRSAAEAKAAALDLVRGVLRDVEGALLAAT